MQTDPSWDDATLGIRAGSQRTNELEHSTAIFATSSFVFRSAAEAAAVFKGDVAGNIYSRFTNPTVRAFEERLAAMEGGECCVGTASGMASILAVILSLLKQGDHIVCARTVFGATINLLNNYLTKFGVGVSYVDPTDMTAWERACAPQTRMLFVESPSNPLLEIADLCALADIAHRADAILVVDNCLLTSALQKPLALGADLVIHSATKYLDGQGRCVGGAVVGDRKRVGEQVFGFMRSAGPSMSPFNAWVFLKGLETLQLRMPAHCANAQRLAEWLARQPAVRKVYYPGLPDHPQHDLAKRQQRGHGGVVSFEMHGGRAAAWRLIDATRLCSITANLGDVRTTITHPATTTHGRITAQARAVAGIGENLVRIAVGLESIEDIQADLAAGLS